MEHTEIGEVVEVSSRTVQIRLNPTEDCSSCGAKSSCHTGPGNSKERFVVALDPFGVKVGQRVKINLEPKHLVKASIIVFIFPIFGLLLGALLGSHIAQISGYKNYLDLWSVAGGLLGIGITIIGLREYNKKLEKTNNYHPTVVEVV